jgi:hypothetical protein
LEAGFRLTFASALDWPGWSRSGRGEEAAVEALRDYAIRYAPVAVEAGLEAPDPARIEVVERLAGSRTTDFGVPGAIGALDGETLGTAEAARLVAILQAGWAFFDRVVATAPPILCKGPRGGGRDRDAIVDHVVGAEVEAYARKLGIRLPRPAWDDLEARATEREAIAAALRAAGAGRLAEPATGAEPAAGAEPATGKRWPPRYAARRIGWHVLDHAWEIQDKSV